MPEKATQRGRLLSVATDKGEDYFLIRKIKIKEKICELFSFEVEILHEEDKTDYKPTLVSDTDIIGKSLTVTAKQDDGGTRHFSGIVNRFQQGGRTSRYSFYKATVVPHVWVLTQKFQSRIFQQQSVKQILEKVLEGFQFSMELQGDLKPRNYCVQYRESDWDFACRLMEEEGIFYFFEHASGMDKLILANDAGSHKDCPAKKEIPIFTERKGDLGWNSSFKEWVFEQRLQSGKITQWDHHVQLPGKKLNETKQSRFNAGGNQDLEIYEYPGGYARKYDGVDSGGGESAGDLQNIFTDMRNAVKHQTEARDAHYYQATAIGDCATLTAGHKFKLINHPTADFNREYVVLAVEQEIDQTPDYPGIEEMDRADKLEITTVCIPHGSGAPVYRPKSKTPKPHIYGTQTALVVGSAGEEISTDKYGRIKIQFPWDRHGGNDQGSSCWAPVAQPWAGNGWGTNFIPRIGMEVIVHFIDGNPDQPIVSGCVVNPSNMPSYAMPDKKTTSGIKTYSSPGGGGFNEIRLDDTKGKEQFFIHSQYDYDSRCKHDRKEIVQNDMHLIVDNDMYSKVKGDLHQGITGDRKTKIGGGEHLTVGQSTQIKTGMSYAHEAGMEIHLKAGMKCVIEAGMQLSLKVGGSFVDINPAGVFITGPMVMINSGGAAGSGGGSSPDSPTDPTEACEAESGKSAAPPSSSPPPPQGKYQSPAANAMSNAADGGTPLAHQSASGGGGTSVWSTFQDESPLAATDAPPQDLDGSHGS